MNTKLRTEAKNDSEKDFFKLMNNAVFGITMENVRKHRDIKLLATDKRRNQLSSENFMAIEMKATKVKMNLGMLILDISKTLMYKFWYDYIKSNCQDKAKLCYMDTNSFAIQIKTEYFNEDIANGVEE